MISAAEREAPIRKSCAAGSAAISSARASASVAAPGKSLRPNTAPARAVSAAQSALSRPAASAQVATDRSTPPPALRSANSTMRAGEAPAVGERVVDVTSAHRSVDSRSSSAETWPSSSA